MKSKHLFLILFLLIQSESRAASFASAKPLVSQQAESEINATEEIFSYNTVNNPLVQTTKFSSERKATTKKSGGTNPGMLSFVTGIVAIGFYLFAVAESSGLILVIGALFGVTAFIAGIVGLKKPKKGFAIAGMILGGAWILGSILLFINSI